MHGSLRMCYWWCLSETQTVHSTPLQVVHASLQAMLPKEVRPSDPELIRPDEDEVEKTTEETRQALEKLVQKKVAAALPVRAAEKTGAAQYIR